MAEKKIKNPIYVVLGAKASIFHSPGLGLKLVGKQVAEISSVQANYKKVASALAGGHLVKISKEEAMERIGDNKADENLTIKRVDKTNNQELLEAFKADFDNEDLSEKQLINKYNREKLVSILKELGYEEEIGNTETKAELYEEIRILLEEEDEDE